MNPVATPAAVPFERWLELFREFERVSTVEAREVVRGAEERLKRQQAALQKIHRTRVRRQVSEEHHMCVTDY